MPPAAQAAAAAPAEVGHCWDAVMGTAQQGSLQWAARVLFGIWWAPIVHAPPMSTRELPLQPKKVDYMDLPQPVRYEELQREVMSEWRVQQGAQGGAGHRHLSLPFPQSGWLGQAQPAW